MVVVGVEAAGHRHQTLVGHLGDRDGLVVRLLNPAQVVAVRKQQGNRRRKTDWLDAAASVSLLARGEGSPVYLDASPAATLRPLWSGPRTWSMPAVGYGSRPGRWSTACGRGSRPADSHAGVAQVLPAPFRHQGRPGGGGVVGRGLDPARVAATSVAGLRQVFAARGCRLSRPLAGRLIGRAASALPAHPAASAGKAAALAGLLGALAALDGQIGWLEAEMAPLLAATQGAQLTQIRGVATVAAAGFVAFVGHTGRWSEWSKVWRAAGLDPAATNRRHRPKLRHQPGRLGLGPASDPGPGRRRLPPARTLPRQLPGPAPCPQAPQGGAGRSWQPGRADLLCPDERRRLRPDHQAKRIQRRTGNPRKAGGRAA